MSEIHKAAAGTTAEKNREIIEATTVIRSEDISKANNTQIALLFYYLIANGSEKDTDDFLEIGKHLHSFAVQLKNQN